MNGPPEARPPSIRLPLSGPKFAAAPQAEIRIIEAFRECLVERSDAELINGVREHFA